MSSIDLIGLFKTDSGAKIYNGFLRAVSDFNLYEKIQNGVIVGFSGGADSVTLLLALKRF